MIQAQITQIRLHDFDLLPFCPILDLIIVISFTLSTQGTLLYAYYSVAVIGNFSAETHLKKYWKLTVTEQNRRKTAEKLHQKRKAIFLCDSIFNLKTNLLQRGDFENIVNVPRY